MNPIFVNTPEPPYYAVIFTFTMRENLSAAEAKKYTDLANSLMVHAKKIDGFYGEEAAKGDNLAITVSYWRDEAAIKIWRDDARHIAARKMGKDKWYDTVSLRVAKVERSSIFSIADEI